MKFTREQERLTASLAGEGLSFTRSPDGAALRIRAGKISFDPTGRRGLRETTARTQKRKRQ